MVQQTFTLSVMFIFWQGLDIQIIMKSKLHLGHLSCNFSRPKASVVQVYLGAWS